ncbi:hypothetical protein [Streptomyces sp. NPDC058739]|uniref:hypothetical protein n=1 Tax=Streptomyces sp. NPDC058739 TaxID=3346618 RepID=UPI0036A61D63
MRRERFLGGVAACRSLAPARGVREHVVLGVEVERGTRGTGREFAAAGVTVDDTRLPDEAETEVPAETRVV